MAPIALPSAFSTAATLTFPLPSSSSPSHHPSAHAAISSAPFPFRRHLTTLHPTPLLPPRRLTLISRPAAAAAAAADSTISRPGPALFFLTKLGLDHKEVEAILLRHPEFEPAAAAASPESLRHRIDILQSIGLTDFALRQTIARRPDILTSPETGIFLNFIYEEVTELRPEKLERLLAGTHPTLFPGLVTKIKLLLRHGFPHERLGNLLNFVDVKRVFYERSIEEIEEMVLFLKGYGWPDIIVRRPKLLNLDLHGQLIPRAEFLTELAGSDQESATVVIRKLPAILAYTVEHLQSHMEFWRSVGLSDEQVFKIALVYPNIFSVGREGKLSSRIEFLQHCRLDSEDIFKFLIKAPLFVSLSFRKNLAKKLAFLVKLGYRYRTKEMALAVGAATRTSVENMHNVIGLFFSYGFSCEDVLAMSRKHPQVLQYNCESLEKKMEFLIEEMEREVGELLSFPAFLGYKLDDRIKYRYEIMRETRGKGLSFNKLLSVSDDKFCSKTNKSIEAVTDCKADEVVVL